MNTPCDIAPTLKWPTPGGKALHSLPLGNGDIGVNAWMESPGELLLYISKTDAWSEHGRLLKLGRVRISMDPPLMDSSTYEESFHPSTATMEVKTVKNGINASLKIWVDANLPVIRVQIESDICVQLRASLELWRTAERQLTEEELHVGLSESPHTFIEGADTILPPQRERIIWFHRNTTSIWPFTMQQQGLTDWSITQRDPLLGRTFGCAMEGNGLRALNEKTLQSSQPQKTWCLEIYPHTSLAANTEDWYAQLEHNIDCVAKTPLEQARVAHCDWWATFWNRSWIRVSGSADAEKVGEAYQLQRYYLACSGRGNAPIKFNGSIFTVDHPPLNADYRRWGGGYWFQNTRLAYWPMLASGDTEFMWPLFDMFESQLPLAQFRTKKYFHHQGAYFAETQSFFGAYQNFEFGWDGTAASNGEIPCEYIRWHFNGNLELLAIMVAYFEYTGDRTFAKQRLIPMSVELLSFFDKHYPRTGNGQLRLEPGQSLETYWGAVNNTPDLAGLRYVLDKLLNLPVELLDAEVAQSWRNLRHATPEIPVDLAQRRILPAEQFGTRSNCENPELYAVFPFQLYGVGLPNLDMGKNTYAARVQRMNIGWSQDEIHAALLGLTDEAQRGLTSRFSTREHNSLIQESLGEIPRFPAVWGPNFDWYPDMDHGGSGMIALQQMLIQTRGEVIHILPAWPREWDVDFKLCIPGGAVITGAFKQGKIDHLDVAPTSDSRRVIIHTAQEQETV